ncbi:MAG TPA: ATPase, T2SS/T4P/T4SS family, partial [Candidatus Paceibacterota bacterium]|nr:ATPase, T2SS/T4P/T4SS family [Candidatus Paceibacterota bacterium]
MAIQEYKSELVDLIESVIREGASDLHLSEGHVPTLRVNGGLIPLMKKEVLKREDTDAFLSLLMSAEYKKLFLERKEIDFSYEYKEGARFRGNAYFQQGHVSIALRFIPKAIQSLEDLKLPSILGDFARKKQGFFLVVGPVGQGKSTTLASMIELINQERAEHIVTIEDPIEYQYEQKKSIIDQREVHNDTKDFATALVS